MIVLTKMILLTFKVFNRIYYNELNKNTKILYSFHHIFMQVKNITEILKQFKELINEQ